MTTTSTKNIAEQAAIHVVLVPGFWIGGWAWDGVLQPLREAGLTPHPVTLPGLDGDGDRPIGDITRTETVAAVADLVAGLNGDIVLVGHSGGGPLIQQVADQTPERFRRLVFVDSGPLVDGARSAQQTDAEAIPLPSWHDLAEQGSSIEGISADGLARFAERAVPQPAAVACAPVHVGNPSRLRIPVTAICTSIPSGTLRELATPGGPLSTELLDYADLTWVDLRTGHWPMFSRPDDLAAALVTAARA
ncbi:alpha/beta fold hydrolase [Microlunatus soli]|uniref:Pimeloyl-ACP methyl ester carboxylesterase n=1 Tax=Microlunatus soli TaxID=630515 RepID=A0A1H1RP09_9ACTN|nr:alpha/beta hydrolase [Microlunatus soli]SDS37537.1 Pimeloyl-ACP methyl ester carboxylesterase [Microlunatus soli]